MNGSISYILTRFRVLTSRSSYARLQPTKCWHSSRHRNIQICTIAAIHSTVSGRSRVDVQLPVPGIDKAAV